MLIWLLQCHYSYSACGLGSDGTNRLVKLVMEMQHAKDFQPEDGTLYGAKITGGGSGGTVCVVGRNCLRSSQQILEVISILGFFWTVNFNFKRFSVLVCSDSAEIQEGDGIPAVCLWGLIAWCRQVWVFENPAPPSSKLNSKRWLDLIHGVCILSPDSNGLYLSSPG